MKKTGLTKEARCVLQQSTGKIIETVVVWFRNDLRLRDNEVLRRAIDATRSNPGVQVLPIFIFDSRQFRITKFGSRKTGAFRARFLRESVQNLRVNLEGIGSGLFVGHGKPEEVLPKFLKEYGVSGRSTSVYFQQEVTSEEEKVQHEVRLALEKMGAKVESVWGSTLFHLNDLPFSTPDLKNMPDVFTPFRNKVEKVCSVREVLSPPKKSELPLLLKKNSLSPELTCSLTFQPTLTELGLSSAEEEACCDERAAFSFVGGESTGNERMQQWIWRDDKLKVYFDTRNGMLGSDYSSKFAPWLAFGCISPRSIYNQCKRYESTRYANKSTYWLVFELLWRDFFRFYCLKHGNKVFSRQGVVPRQVEWKNCPDSLLTWKEGRTGLPLVDANMRELLLTGFMSNRGRQNVASYLVFDMKCDWRFGADHFESYLIDYDPCSNWGNWLAAAGLTGGRLNHFNCVKQGKDYDCNGNYIRHWLPELKDVPTCYIHKPWTMPSNVQTSSGCVIGKDYPAWKLAGSNLEHRGREKGSVSSRMKTSTSGACDNDSMSIFNINLKSATKDFKTNGSWNKDKSKFYAGDSGNAQKSNQKPQKKAIRKRWRLQSSQYE